MKKIAVLVIVVAGASAGLLWRSRQAGARDDSTIVISGNIELTQVDLAFKVPGRLELLTVEEGALVKKGQLLARLDQEQARRVRDREQSAVAIAESQVAQIETAIRWQRDTVERDIELRKADLEATEARFAELRAGPRLQEVAQARAAVDEVGAQQQQAARDWERAQVLYSREDISTQQRDQFQARYTATSSVLRQAQERLAVLEEGTRREVLEAARANVDRARAALRLAETNRLEVRRREQEMEARRADLERARAQLAVVVSQLEDTVSLAPIDGTVLVKTAEAGEVVAAGRPVLTLGDLRKPWVRGYISETHLGKVRIGDEVKVTTDSYPGKQYLGRISFLSQEAEFTPRQIQTQEERTKLVYRFKVDIENPHQELKSNMPVEAEIRLHPPSR